MIIAELTITPLTDDDLTPFIDAAVDVIKNSGLKYEVDAMGTTIEGEIDQIFDVVRNAHEAVKRLGAERVMTEIRIDDRTSGVTIEQEVDSYRASV